MKKYYILIERVYNISVIIEVESFKPETIIETFAKTFDLNKEKLSFENLSTSECTLSIPENEYLNINYSLNPIKNHTLGKYLFVIKYAETLGMGM